MLRIALIECWFGPFPVWHDFYLKTCAANPTVQFFIIHDAPRPRRTAPNITWIRLEKGELEKQAELALGFPVRLSSGFKMCDLRPAYGAVFAGHLRDFDFWGYNDSDMFWGDVRRFLPDRILEVHEVLTACRASIVGQLTLFRNEGPAREPFKLIPEYAVKLSRPEPGYLDEVILDESCEKAGLRIYRRQLQVHDVGSDEWEAWARRRHREEACDPDEWFWEAGTCRWRDGKLHHIATGKEVMFVHFKSWKSRWKQEHRVPRLAYWDRHFDGFEVGETGVVPIPNSPRAVIWSCYALRFLAPMRIRAVASRLRNRGEQALRGVRRRLIR